MPTEISLRAQIMLLLSDTARLKRYRAAGKAAVKAVTGSTSNACATTGSQPLIELGLLAKPFFLAEQLCDWADAQGWQKITDRRQVKPGDLIKCDDLNHNKLSDHVWWAMSAPNDKLYAQCFDNQTAFPAHSRNLGRGPRTPMVCAYRPPH
jgi:hypothetical protein